MGIVVCTFILISILWEEKVLNWISINFFQSSTELVLAFRNVFSSVLSQFSNFASTIDKVFQGIEKRVF